MNTAPIALFVYNRPKHTQLTVEALQKNVLASQTSLFVYADAAKNEADLTKVSQIREYIKTIKGFRSVKIIERTENYGLARSIITGVSEVIANFGKIIVMEDDLVSSPLFLTFMNDCLALYEHNDQIFAVSGYSPPIEFPTDYTDSVYLFHRIGSWGWATWRNRWELTDWNVADFKQFIGNPTLRSEFNKGGMDCSTMLLKQQTGVLDVWAIRFSYTAFRNGMFTVYPVNSFIQNIGTDGSGENLNSTKKYATTLSDKKLILPKHPKLNNTIAENFKAFYRPSLVRQFINHFKITLYNCDYSNALVIRL